MKKVIYLWALKCQGRMKKANNVVGWEMYESRAAAKLRAGEDYQVVKVRVIMEEGAP